ncbi:hypothetical protein CC1G_02091 [Coprinopsis cinerea okayama7|uniref:Uncharacterized protein n=1 Tax=Coprinopsis cinerea (strain Okayama-7 / 130 / ATCC MYA-4618 / FGSC 9003) TaxID=240176 RepID=A8NK55_COPC7|nr:hypothetical protein CC1G_02091 [Coprinopsis cinerea okayama7\|eukprot:XP_001834355.2 hypothetical protein CC1G_02091 [Coprinopsis cinerea okayama7\
MNYYPTSGYTAFCPSAPEARVPIIPDYPQHGYGREAEWGRNQVYPRDYANSSAGANQSSIVPFIPPEYTPEERGQGLHGASRYPHFYPQESYSPYSQTREPPVYVLRNFVASDLRTDTSELEFHHIHGPTTSPRPTMIRCLTPGVPGMRHPLCAQTVAHLQDISTFGDASIGLGRRIAQRRAVEGKRRGATRSARPARLGLDGLRPAAAGITTGEWE